MLTYKTHTSFKNLTSDQGEYSQPPGLQSPWQLSLLLGLTWPLQKRSSTFWVLPSAWLILAQYISRIRYPRPHWAVHSLLRATCHLHQEWGYIKMILTKLKNLVVDLKRVVLTGNTNLSSHSVLQASVRAAGLGVPWHLWSDTTTLSDSLLQRIFRLRSPIKTQ